MLMPSSRCPKMLLPKSLAQLNPKPIEEKLIELARSAYDQKEKEARPENMRLLERLVMLRVIDSLWIEHLTNMENQRQQASLDSLQQMKAVDAYKRIGYEQFQLLLDTIRQDVSHMIFHVNLRTEGDKRGLHTHFPQSGGRCRKTRRQNGAQSHEPKRPEGKSRPQRPLPLRQRQEIQALLWEIAKPIS